MAKVYRCGWSLKEDRPKINFELEENRRNDWLAVAEVVMTRELPLESYPAISVRVMHPYATDWDCYMMPGASGLFSQRFVDIVGGHALQCFTLLTARLNGEPYYFLYCIRTIDCLDRERSQIEVFPDDTSQIMDITHYAFVEDRLPEGMLFCIPDIPDLFATEAVAARVQKSALRGVRMDLLP
ncbi:MAG: hypothetical protein IT426_17415 [Pirellulales bacterium]|nr:hypothetical protein [Pirellulales bacterium]